MRVVWNMQKFKNASSMEFAEFKMRVVWNMQLLKYSRLSDNLEILWSTF